MILKDECEILGHIIHQFEIGVKEKTMHRVAAYEIEWMINTILKTCSDEQKQLIMNHKNFFLDEVYAK